MSTTSLIASPVPAPDVRVIEHVNGQPVPLPTPDADRWRRVRAVADWMRDSALSVASVLLVLAVAAAGWSASFLSLHTFAMVHMALTERQAWLVPATFDGAAFGLSLLAFRAATFGRASLGSRAAMYGFTGLSSWINFIHITDPRGRLVASLLPISAVLIFDKVLKEARGAYERRTGRQVFRVRPGLLLLRLAVDRASTWAAFKAQITAVPVPSLVGLGPAPKPDQEPNRDANREPERRVAQMSDRSSKPKRRRTDAQLLAQARQKFRGQAPTAEAIRKHLKVGLPIARRLRDQLLAEQSPGSTV